MRTLAIIPARGGSKGIQRKNIKMLCGKPLIQYTAEASHAARRLSDVILSTEDKEIAEIAQRCGLKVPFLRPVELAQDDTPTLPVVQHAVAWMESYGERFDAICLLQPTNPFRRAEDIDACVELLEKSEADAVVTILPVPAEHNPHWVYFENDDGLLHLSTGETNPIPRRQSLPPAFKREGSIYVTKRNVVMEENSLYGKRLVGYLMNPTQSVNIDSQEDWHQAETLLESTAALKVLD